MTCNLTFIKSIVSCLVGPCVIDLFTTDSCTWNERKTSEVCFKMCRAYFTKCYQSTHSGMGNIHFGVQSVGLAARMFVWSSVGSWTPANHTAHTAVKCRPSTVLDSDLCSRFHVWFTWLAAYRGAQWSCSRHAICDVNRTLIPWYNNRSLPIYNMCSCNMLLINELLSLG